MPAMNDAPSPGSPPDWQWIDDPSGLAALAERMHQAPWIALDTESNSMYAYREQICLIQLNIGGHLALIDTLALADDSQVLAALAGPLADPGQPCYTHGGEYDVACLKRDYGLALGGLFDTQQAATLLGLPGTGYGTLVERLCGISLPKGHSTYNWATRPIDPQALHYAVDDVRHLPSLVEHLEAEIRARDLVEEMAIACQAVMDTDAHRSVWTPEQIRFLPGFGALTTAQRGIALALATWRDGEAAARNLPAGRILSNQTLVELSRRGATNFSSLKRVRLPGWVLRELGEALIDVIRQAHRQPPPLPELPPSRQPDPAERPREARLKDWRRQEATRRDLPVQTVLPARALQHLARHGAADLSTVPQLGDKRIRLYGEVLRRLCATRS